MRVCELRRKHVTIEPETLHEIVNRRDCTQQIGPLVHNLIWSHFIYAEQDVAGQNALEVVGDHPVEYHMRAGVATVLLEHLLEYHLDTYLPQAETAD